MPRRGVGRGVHEIIDWGDHRSHLLKGQHLCKALKEMRIKIMSMSWGEHARERKQQEQINAQSQGHTWDV